MSELRERLRNEFLDEEYRYAYAQSFLNSKLANQIKILREQRGKKQAELASLAGTKQAGFSRFENINHSTWKTDTLWKIARALGVRLNISFETFGTLIDEKERFSRQFLQRPPFEDDAAFKTAEDGFFGCQTTPSTVVPIDTKRCKASAADFQLAIAQCSKQSADDYPPAVVKPVGAAGAASNLEPNLRRPA